MVGRNVVCLDLGKEYPKLHPVFNVSLITKYHPPNQIAERGHNSGIREEYYSTGKIIDWSLLHSVLDFRSRQKGKFEFLLRWKNAGPGEDTWVSQQHIPYYLRSYMTNFRELMEKYAKDRPKKGK